MTIGSGVFEGAGVEFPTFPLTCVVALKTLWHYRASVWYNFSRIINIFLTKRLSQWLFSWLSTFILQFYKIILAFAEIKATKIKRTVLRVSILRISTDEICDFSERLNSQTIGPTKKIVKLKVCNVIVNFCPSLHSRRQSTSPSPVSTYRITSEDLLHSGLRL